MTTYILFSPDTDNLPAFCERLEELGFEVAQFIERGENNWIGISEYHRAETVLHHLYTSKVRFGKGVADAVFATDDGDYEDALMAFRLTTDMPLMCWRSTTDNLSHCYSVCREHNAAHKAVMLAATAEIMREGMALMGETVSSNVENVDRENAKVRKTLAGLFEDVTRNEVEIRSMVNGVFERWI
ncbi:hypothetical protein GAY31_20040 [Azospirillum brasilense]|nr:hypothetical protein [Azospirillum brasilense]